MLAEFGTALAKDFRSVNELILRFKVSRNQVNRQSRGTVGRVTMLPNLFAAMKALYLFPSKYWVIR
ncbi:hypothetical protein V7S43_014727 [Phytophthora oleae]|uniref:Uncharacterized protein n=1 Tax=Phytophthora oleae TaxID=2107226 RepID=A0ABD3F188_9STRA